MIPILNYNVRSGILKIIIIIIIVLTPAFCRPWIALSPLYGPQARQTTLSIHAPDPIHPHLETLTQPPKIEPHEIVVLYPSSTLPCAQRHVLRPKWNAKVSARLAERAAVRRMHFEFAQGDASVPLFWWYAHVLFGPMLLGTMKIRVLRELMGLTFELLSPRHPLLHPRQPPSTSPCPSRRRDPDPNFHQSSRWCSSVGCQEVGVHNPRRHRSRPPI